VGSADRKNMDSIITPPHRQYSGSATSGVRGKIRDEIIFLEIRIIRDVYISTFLMESKSK